MHHAMVQDELHVVTRPLQQQQLARRRESGRHHYRVNTWGNRRCDGHANDRLVYLPYYSPHSTTDGRRGSKNCVVLSGWTASCGMCGSQRSQRCKAKWTYSATTAEAGVQVEHRLNLARSHETDRENDYENRSLVFSYERCHNVKMESWVPYYSVPYLLLKWKYVMPVVFSSQKPIDIASPAAAQQK